MPAYLNLLNYHKYEKNATKLVYKLILQATQFTGNSLVNWIYPRQNEPSLALIANGIALEIEDVTFAQREKPGSSNCLNWAIKRSLSNLIHSNI